jgi:hypothetical protein
VIWIILALINADKDSKYLTSGGGKKSGRLSKKSNQQPVNSYIDQVRSWNYEIIPCKTKMKY